MSIGKAELRQYSNYEECTHLFEDSNYKVIDSIDISESGVQYLSTPETDEDDDQYVYQWVYVGNRAERLRGLGITQEELENY